MKKEQQEMKNEQYDMKSNIQNIEKNVKQIEKTLYKVKDNQEEIYAILNVMDNEQKKMKKEQKETKEELTRLGNTVTRIEVEHGEKINLILEVLVGHTDKLNKHEKRFEKGKNIIDMQNCKIYGIEQKIKK